MNTPLDTTSINRRRFLRTTTGAAAALSALSVERFAHAAENNTIKLGMIGCGGRGTGATNQALAAIPNIQLVAVGELFQDIAERAIKNLSATHSTKVDVTPDRLFLGFDAYKKVIAACDVVVCATPPTYRPMMFEEAVKQGKHAFLEKPVAVDAIGIRRVLAAAEEAKKKNLKVGVGLQRRHKPGYLEAVKRVQDGAIGDVVYGRTFWDMGAARAFVPRKEGWNELEFQLHNQFYFAWLCGDIIVDQGLHNIDVFNWIKGTYPVTAKGVCGAEVRRGKDAGWLMDHYAIEYEYADGTRLFHQNRQIPDCFNYVAENAHGTKGSLECINDRTIFNITGPNEWKYQKEVPTVDPYQQEHNDLFKAILNNEPYMEAERGAKSTMTAIMGRMAGWSGQLLKWDDAIASEVAFGKEFKDLSGEPPILPNAEGNYTLPTIGKYKAI
ncbi:MAG: Gfo/Idh/MocA family oxidoreductase [Chthoniobacter sp.]|uniref:Gfo/Idh/MocA family protein n=1 Tax=Chthoniobacter sp. TaxID=2510640 RepID=UPI0032A92A67